MKVIEPLFLNELNEEFENNQHNPQKLEKLLGRLSTIRIFDPACGSGNFLIIAYKELRLLEIKILKQFKALSEAARGLDDVQASLIPKAQMSLAAAHMPSLFSRINLSQFYGIELDDFAHEIAILSLWLAEHQMNVKFNEEFQKKLPSLPLKQGGKIVCDNATRVDWESVCPKDDKHEIYILGNPPYLGESMLKSQHKEDMKIVFAGVDNYKKQDYISCWFFKAANYTNEFVKFAFVSTSSVCQGIQAGMLWPHVFARGLEIFFAHQSFQWSNNAKNKAGVVCVIVGVRPNSNKPKTIYKNGLSYSVKNISAYLTEGSNKIIKKTKDVISARPIMMKGNGVYDGGNFMLTPSEKEALLKQCPEANTFLKRVTGSDEFINGVERWCIWINEAEKIIAYSISPLKDRIEKVRVWRDNSGVTAKAYSTVPYRFKGINRPKKTALIIPAVSSDKREYIPVGFLDADTIITDLALMILDPEIYIFGIITSKMHMAWVRILAGRLGTGFRYSSGVCYNTFPIPEISERQKEIITTHVLNVLEEREKHPERNLAELYDAKKMPPGLREAHQGLDQAVERCYRAKPFTSDEERLEHLFKLYEEMTSEENRRAS